MVVLRKGTPMEQMVIPHKEEDEMHQCGEACQATDVSKAGKAYNANIVKQH